MDDKKRNAVVGYLEEALRSAGDALDCARGFVGETGRGKEHCPINVTGGASLAIHHAKSAISRLMYAIEKAAELS